MNLLAGLRLERSEIHSHNRDGYWKEIAEEEFPFLFRELSRSHQRKEVVAQVIAAEPSQESVGC